MATDYYKMGQDLGGAWFEGQELGRQKKRQEERDERERKAFENQQLVFNQGQEQYAATTAALAGDEAPAGRGLPAGPIGVRDVAPEAPVAPAAPAAPTDNTSKALMKQLEIARATRNPQLYTQTTAALAAHRTNLEDAAEADRILKAAPEELTPLFRHINTNSKTISTKQDGKYTLMSVIDDKGDWKEAKLSRADLVKIAIAERKIQRGDMSGLEDIASVNKLVADAVKREIDLTMQVTEKSNLAAHQQNIDAYHTTMGEAAKQRARSSGAVEAKQLELLRQEQEGRKLAGHAGGLRQGYEAAKSTTFPDEYQLNPDGSVMKGPDQRPVLLRSGADRKKAAMEQYGQQYGNAQTTGTGLGVKIPSLNTRPDIDPKAYFDALAKARTVYDDEGAAQEAVDRMFGIAPAIGPEQLVEALKAMDAKAGAAKKGTGRSTPTSKTTTPEDRRSSGTW